MPQYLFAQSEIDRIPDSVKAILFGKDRAIETTEYDVSLSPGRVLDENDEFAHLYPMSVSLVAKFIKAGLHPNTLKTLQFFGQHGERVETSKLLAILGMSYWRDLRGVIAGTTKRIRNMTGDQEATVMGWDDSEAEYKDDTYLAGGHIRVSPVTAEALKRYFASRK
jgi:hypothetical protein